MSVEVKLELGHRAIKRESITQEGFTHDWTVFVRGAEGNNIQYFVEKVVFHLHDSFPKPKRVVKEPPYSVSESGYAGFIMPIEVYFRTREEPKKVTFRYDMYLRLEQPPVNNIRIEKLTFQNPSDDFRNKLLKAGGLAGTLSASAAGGSASLSTQACAPPPQTTDDHQSNHPKVGEKKPRSHVPSKELPIKPAQPPPPKPSQPFTDIFGAPIRTKSSPDSSSVKSKESGHSSQTKNKVTQNNSSSASSTKEGKSSSKESHKSKDSHHSNKDSHHSTKESSHSSKDSHPSKDTHHSLKEIHLPKDSQQQLKDSHSSKESHHSTKETHHAVKEHSKEGHKTKDNHHSSKGSKSSKDSRPSESKDGKQSKSSKSDKELNKTSSTKRAAPTDSHSSHGNVEKKKKTSPVSSESSDKSSSQSKHKVKEGKEKTEKHKVKSLGNSVKKEEEKPKPKSSPAKSSPAPPPPAPAEPKDMPKPKPNSPFKEPSIQPSPVMKLPSPVSGEGGKPSDSSSMDSDSDESHKSFYNKAEYSSPASSISESSLHGGNRISGLLSDNSIVSPLSDEEDDSSSFFHKRKHSSDYELDVSSPEFKTTENKPMPKLKKKHHSHHKSSKSKPAENYHRGNGSINNDITMHHSPTHDQINNSINNTAYREELLELQRVIMSLSDRKVLQNIVDLIEKTGKYQVTNTTFDFDLCSLDPAIIQKIRLCLTSCDKYV